MNKEQAAAPPVKDCDPEVQARFQALAEETVAAGLAIACGHRDRVVGLQRVVYALQAAQSESMAVLVEAARTAAAERQS